MTLITHPDLVQGSDDWLAQRRGIVTASVVGQLLTTRKLGAIDYACPLCFAEAQKPCCSKRNPQEPIKTLHPDRAEYARNQTSSTIIEPASNDTSRGLTMLLAAERITGWTESTFINDDMWNGIECEPLARAKYSEKFSPVTEVGFMTEDRWGCRIGFSPDGLVGDDGAIEIKTRRPKGHLATIIAGRPPIENIAQLQAGLLVSGRKWLDYVSFCAGMPLWVHRVYPDQRWFDAIVSAVRSFEANAAEIIRLYDEGVAGLPMTERVIEAEIRI